MYEELVKRLRHNAINADSGNEIGEAFYADIMQAADAIEELSKPRWIPVSERLPDVPGTYLVFVKEPKKYTESRIRGEVEEWENFDFSYVKPAFYNNDQSVWDDDDILMNANLDVVNTYEAFHVTHWMPLPEPPKEET